MRASASDISTINAAPHTAIAAPAARIAKRPAGLNSDSAPSTETDAVQRERGGDEAEPVGERRGRGRQLGAMR